MKQFSEILAVGAAGNYAGLVVPELAKRGARVRGLVRKKDQIEKAGKNGAAEFASNSGTALCCAGEFCKQGF